MNSEISREIKSVKQKVDKEDNFAFFVYSETQFTFPLELKNVV